MQSFLSTELKKNPGGFKDKLEVWAPHDNTDVSEISSTHKEAGTIINL